MGHIRLGRLPQSRKWRDVVAALDSGAPVEDVAARASEAARGALDQAGDDPLFLSVVGFMAHLPVEARGPDFRDAMAARGIVDLDSAPGILAGIAGWFEAESLALGHRSDIADIGRSALLAALSRQFERDLPGLFEPSGAEIRRVLGRLSSGERFSGLARDFFAGVVQRVLDSYLSRELARHVGRERRFASDAERVAFDRALAQHAYEAARIIEAYAGGWYGKALWQRGSLAPEGTQGFTRYAMTKLRRELQHRDHAA